MREERVVAVGRSRQRMQRVAGLSARPLSAAEAGPEKALCKTGFEGIQCAPCSADGAGVHSHPR